MSRKPSRREFAKKLAGLAAAPLAVGTTEAQQAKDPAVATAAALADVARIKYGKLLSADELKAVQRSLERGQRSAAILKPFKLTNGDEPAFVFDPEVP